MGALLVVIIFLPLAAAAAVMLAGNHRPGFARGAALAVTVVTLALTAIVVLKYQPRPAENTRLISPQMEFKREWMTFGVPTWAPGGSGESKLQFYVGVDGISLWLVALTAFMMVPAVLISWNAVQDRVADYYALLLMLQTSVLGVFLSFDLMLFYVFFEFTLIPLYFLIGKWGGPRKRYAAGKFFVYTLTGSLVGLVGIVALVLTLAAKEQQPLTFSIPELADGMQRQMQICEGLPANADQPIVLGAATARAPLKQFWQTTQWWIFLALFCGFAIKVPLFPFHTWLPIVHVEAPTAGSVQLACVLLKLGTYGFLRLCLPLLPYGCLELGVPLAAALASIGIAYGALCALAQTDVKKLVAYSSVSHLGFCVLGMFALNEEGVTGSVVQSVNHGLSTGGLFLLIGMLYERYHSRDMNEVGGVAAKLPMLSLLMVFMCLSSAGLPGLNGFVGEALTMVGMFRVHPLYAAVGASSVLLGAWYLFTLMRGSLFGPLKEPIVHEPVHDLSARELWTMIPICIACLAIGLYPRPMLDSMRTDVDVLVGYYRNVTPKHTTMAENARDAVPLAAASIDAAK